MQRYYCGIGLCRNVCEYTNCKNPKTWCLLISGEETGWSCFYCMFIETRCKDRYFFTLENKIKTINQEWFDHAVKSVDKRCLFGGNGIRLSLESRGFDALIFHTRNRFNHHSRLLTVENDGSFFYEDYNNIRNEIIWLIIIMTRANIPRCLRKYIVIIGLLKTTDDVNNFT